MLWCFSWSGPRRTAERRNTNTLSALRNAQSLLLTHEVNKTPPRELLVVSSIIFAPLKKKKKYEKNTYQHCKKLFPCLEHKRAHLWNDLLWAPIGTESDLALIKKNKTACASLSCRVVCQDWFWRAALLFFILTREGGHSAPLSVSSALTQTDRNRGEGGKERKGSAEARSAQNPESEHKPLNRIFKKGFFVIWWRRWMTECFFKMSFMGNIQNVFSSQVVRYQMLLRHSSRKEVAHICVRTDLQTLLTQSKLHFFCFFFFFLAW